MKKQKNSQPLSETNPGGPQSALEHKFIEEYLERRGYSFTTVSALPANEARALMKEACSYASLKLAEIESRAHMRASIHIPG